MLASVKAQVFITGTDHSPLVRVVESEEIQDFALFHVEQGKVGSLNDLELKGEAQ